MRTVEEFAQTFPNERVLQQALAKLFSKVPNHTGVQILQGSSELGKDIIFYTPAAFGKKDLNACVVKNTKITGNASAPTGARTVFNQAQQCLDSPLLDENGHEQRVKRVFIVTPHPIPPETVSSIVGALRVSNDQVQFISGVALLELFKLHWPEYLAEEFKLIQTYADTLKETTATAKELDGLSFQYQLGTVDTSVKRVYVQPHFHRIIRSYSLHPLCRQIPEGIRDGLYDQGMIEDLKNRLKNIVNFIGTLVQWGLCEEKTRASARATCNQLAAEIDKSWSKALTSRAARASGATILGDSYAAKLPDISQLNGLLVAAKTAINEALRGVKDALDLLDKYVTQPIAVPSPSFVNPYENTINKLDEVARITGSHCLSEKDERSTTLSSSTVADYDGSLFIVAPAGFGKTSFCRWHALNDLERLSDGSTRILPVYVPLHQVGRVEGDFKNAFMRHAGVSALLPKDARNDYEKTRVYLDGLDEVADPAEQKHIAQLTRQAVEAEPTLQVIITARDYVYGPWITWLPRLRLSGFDDAQIRELVTKWLDNDKTKITMFFEQLDKSHSLKEMLVTPLLATLTVLVFKQTDKLPENKTRLYEIFVDLHNGGWDLVKSIQRPSRFSGAEKMFVLKRIAAVIHKAKRREMLDEAVATIAKETLKSVDWNVLRHELLRDGLIIQQGPMISFAHHSFQEFLTARHLLGDLNTAQLDVFCEEYLKGSNWWQEVLCFYIDLAGKPQEIRSWLEERVRAVAKYSGRGPAAEERVLFFKRHLDSSFPFAK
jgi:hypothetical protein